MRRNTICRKIHDYGEGTIKQQSINSTPAMNKNIPSRTESLILIPNEDTYLRTPSETSNVVHEKNQICYSYCRMGRSELSRSQECEGL